MTLMWEVRAVEGRLDELVEHVRTHVGPRAEVFRSDGPEPRVVVVDPDGVGPAGVPSELLAGDPHEWRFERVT